ncbi:uncharacterized protein RAG0_09522 [Rhynchosporium agropyri]|uniref:Uncharacterized protein n=1 Tax=Rhynchosporium agropyri TaxID=914238 RepID=A0A1E1KVW1_9HELO|nr:uncharacterized protein RAG0_09522 [Rhynchosporium agropyri]
MTPLGEHIRPLQDLSDGGRKMRTIPEYSTCGMQHDPTHQEKVQIEVWNKAEAAIQDTPKSTRSSGKFKSLKVPAMPDATKDKKRTR